MQAQIAYIIADSRVASQPHDSNHCGMHKHLFLNYVARSLEVMTLMDQEEPSKLVFGDDLPEADTLLPGDLKFDRSYLALSIGTRNRTSPPR